MESVYFNPKRITDCILIYKTKSFHVHQTVLILNSKYFENLSEEINIFQQHNQEEINEVIFMSVTDSQEYPCLRVETFNLRDLF